MHDDPTRMMGRPGDPERRPDGKMRLVIAGLVAVIVGLAIAIAVIASGDDGSPTPSAVPTSPTTTEETPTETESDESEPTIDEPSEETPAEEEDEAEGEEEADPEEGEAEELEDGSGGIEAP